MRRWLVTGLLMFVMVNAEAAKPRALALRRVTLDLPGPPAVIVAADLNHDGRKDLFVIIAYTRWGSITTDRVEEAIEVTEVVPALFDVREARAFLAEPGGGYRQLAAALPLPGSVLAAEAGPDAHPVVALTDDGLSEISLSGEPGAETLAIMPLFEEPSAFAETGAILANLDVVKDVDGDGVPDAVIPTPSGIAIHRGGAGGFAASPSFQGRFPSDERFVGPGGAVRRVPIPDVEDTDGDGKLDLVVAQGGAEPWVAIARGLGEARFAAPRRIELACLLRGASSESERFFAWSGDLDGDHRMDLVTREKIDTGKSDMKQAKQPKMRYRIHRLLPNLTVDPEPRETFEAVGWAFSGAFRDGVDLQFVDLDADGRKDLVTITLDFSMFQALRAVTAKKVSVGLEFHVIAQQPGGSFRLVPDQKLDETLHLDLNRLEISRLGQFQGDFDGDGRIDFVHLGKGKTVTIHRGQPGGRYATKPDLSITLEEEPEDALLVRVRDFDGDGRSDLAVTRTLSPVEAGATSPARLELNLSGEVR